MFPTRLLPLASALAVIGAVAVGPQPGALLAALAASAVVAVVWGMRDLVAVPAERAIRVGHRARQHRESLDRIAAPTHPDTAGRVRSRAPGGILRAA